MRFLILFVFLTAFADTLPQAPKPYEKDESPRVEIGGEILLRYEKQSTNNNALKRAPKGSQGSLNFSVE